MELAIKDILITNSNKKLSNEYKDLVKKYKNLKHNANYNKFLDDLVNKYYYNIINYRSIKEKQITALYNLIEHLTSINSNEELSEKEKEYNRKELKKFIKLINKLEKIVNYLSDSII